MSQSQDLKTSKKSFKRCFYLPGSIDMKNVTSALSSDGVLTILAPKKMSSVQLQQVDEDGNTMELQVSSASNNKQGSSWQQEQEESTSGDGFSSRTIRKTFHSEYTS